MELNSTLKAIINASATKQMPLASASEPLNYSRTLSMTSGTAADQANLSWHDQRTLQSAASCELALTGELADAFGNEVNFSRIKAIYIENLSADDTLIVGAAASNPFASIFADASDALRIRPGGFAFIAAPDAEAYEVTAESADVLKLTHSGDSEHDLTLRIVLLGVVE